MNDPKRRHDDHLESRRNGDRAMSKVAPYALTALIGGGGFGVGLPVLWPDLYRKDPATGTELKEVREDVKILDAKVDTFMRDGPWVVVQNQTRITEALEEITAVLKEMRDGDIEQRVLQREAFKRQLQHFEGDGSVIRR